MTDTDSYIEKLSLSVFLREPVIRSAIQALKIPSGSRVLDAGCGIGSHTFLLAEAVGPGGHVTGLDLSSDFITHANERAKQSKLSGRVLFQEGDLNKLPFSDHTFDWVWSVDCVGYPVAKSLASLKELARVVKPGSSVAILGWSSQQVLPGYPLLEARLNANCSVIADYVRGKGSELNFMRVLGRFCEAGLEALSARTFIGDVQAPLSEEKRSALLSLFEMLWVEPELKLSQEDWAEYQRLCLPESPDFILNLPDYYGFFTYTMFHGRVIK